MSKSSKNTQAARRQLRQAFRDFDIDKSGYIQKHELGVLLKRLTDAFNVEEPSDEQINDILKDLDVNGDGRVSQNQFQVLVEEVLQIIKQEVAFKAQ